MSIKYKYFFHIQKNPKLTMSAQITLRGITWNHTRGLVPLVATAQRFHELNPNIDIHWSKRSLQEFADGPISSLAEQYDLLVIDHPWAGFAARSGVLTPLESVLPQSFLDELAQNSVGQSHTSYQFSGSQWALSIDAACPVSAYRRDLLEKAESDVPRTFEDLISLAKKGWVCCPSIPLDVYGNFLNLLKAAGETIFPNDEEIAEHNAALTALDQLKQLADLISDEFFDLNPIRSLEVMSQSDQFAYMPYTYGYTNYSRVGYAPKLIEFGDVIGVSPEQPGSTMLGGTGIAISSKCKHLKEAAAYSQFVASPDTQSGIFYQAGGQPGCRAAWLDKGLDNDCNHFFSNTLPTLDRAFVRPRYAGYLHFQDNAGFPIHDYLRNGGNPQKVLDTLNSLYRKSLAS